MAGGRRQLGWQLCGCPWHFWYLGLLGVVSVSLYPGSQYVMNLGLQNHHPVDHSLIVLFVILTAHLSVTTSGDTGYRQPREQRAFLKSAALINGRFPPLGYSWQSRALALAEGSSSSSRESDGLSEH